MERKKEKKEGRRDEGGGREEKGGEGRRERGKEMKGMKGEEKGEERIRIMSVKEPRISTLLDLIPQNKIPKQWRKFSRTEYH